MATKTSNYEFNKPEQNDFYDVDVQNENWDKLDKELSEFDDSGATEDIKSFPDFLTKFVTGNKVAVTLRNLKAGLQFVLHAGQIVNNCVTDNAGLPLSAAQGKALMDKYTQLYSDLNTTNNNLSKCNIGYSYNGTDGTNAIYTAIPDGSTVWFSINGNTKVGQELGLSQQYEGVEIIIWKSSDWRGGALAIGGDGSPVMIGQNNGSNSIKWNPLALKSDLSDFIVSRQISVNVTIPNGSPYSTSTYDITCDIPSGYKYVGILRAWCIDPSCFIWNAYFRDEGKNAKIDVSNLNGTQKNTTIFISVLYAKS